LRVELDIESGRADALSTEKNEIGGLIQENARLNNELRKTCGKLEQSYERSQELAREVDRLRDEYAGIPTHAEAEAAYEATKPVPLSDERIKEMVRYATDPEFRAMYDRAREAERALRELEADDRMHDKIRREQNERLSRNLADAVAEIERFKIELAVRNRTLAAIQDAVARLPDVARVAVAKECWKTEGTCWCGAHQMATKTPPIREVHIDHTGQLRELDGTPIVMSGLEPEHVKEALADETAGRMRSLEEVMAEKKCSGGVPRPATNEVLPCPFCGADPDVVGSSTTDSEWVQVRCAKYGCPSRWPMIRGRDRAIENWNRRVPVAPPKPAAIIRVSPHHWEAFEDAGEAETWRRVNYPGGPWVDSRPLWRTDTWNWHARRASGKEERP
jgi:hypothetical protein